MNKNNKRLQINGFGLIAKLRNKIRVKPNNKIQIGKILVSAIATFMLKEGIINSLFVMVQI